VNNNSSNTITIEIVDNPTPTLVLDITPINFSTYFEGTLDNLGPAKAELGTYLASEDGEFVNTINFHGIAGLQSGRIFGNNAYIAAQTGQIKTLDFEDSDIPAINDENFTELRALEEFVISSTQGLTIGELAFDST
jgi:hypothetical protein